MRPSAVSSPTCRSRSRLPGQARGGEGPGRVHPHAGGIPGRQPPDRLTEQGRACSRSMPRTSTRSSRRLACRVTWCWPSGVARRLGAHRSPHYAVQVLATQALARPPQEMFRTELLYALKMLEDKVRTRDHERVAGPAPWASHSSCHPSSYTVAYDLDGDGRKGHLGLGWRCAGVGRQPAEGKGWVSGQSWGYEVRLPPSLNCLAEGRDRARPCANGSRQASYARAARVPGSTCRTRRPS